MLRQVPPSVVYPSPNEWPSTIVSLTNISKDAQAQVTAPNHGFTSQDQGITTVNFQQVRGMTQINALPGLIQQVIDSDNFTVNVNSTQFFPYSSGGIVNVVNGIPAPPVETIGFQTFNTPFHNVFTNN
jgi:hypothetical protein